MLFSVYLILAGLTPTLSGFNEVNDKILEVNTMNGSGEYNRLFNKFSNLSDEDLNAILGSSPEYTGIAKKAVSDILNSNRLDYCRDKGKTNVKTHNTENKEISVYLSEIEKDLHTIKNVLLFL